MKPQFIKYVSMNVKKSLFKATTFQRVYGYIFLLLVLVNAKCAIVIS